MSAWVGLGEGLGLGLASSLQCAGACAPIAVCMTLSPDGERVGWGPLVAFLVGRAGGYLLFVALVALVGLAFVGTGWLTAACGALTTALGILLALHALRLSVPTARLCMLMDRYRVARGTPWLTGIIVGLSPCPTLFLLATSVIGASSPATGAAAIVAFVLATTGLMLAVAMAGRGLLGGRLAGIARAAALLLAIWFAAKGMAMLIAPGTDT